METLRIAAFRSTPCFSRRPAAARDLRAALPGHRRRLHEGQQPLRHLPDRQGRRSRPGQPSARGRHAGHHHQLGNGAARHPDDHHQGGPALAGRTETQVGDGHLLEGGDSSRRSRPTPPLPQERERLLPCCSATNGRRPWAGTRPESRIATTTPSGWAAGFLRSAAIQNLAKQKLLELDDPLARLECFEKYLSQRKLLGSRSTLIRGIPAVRANFVFAGFFALNLRLFLTVSPGSDGKSNRD